MERKRALIYLGIVFASLALIWAVLLLPAMGDKKVADAFAEPLFTHALPEGAEQVQQEADRSKTDGGKMTAAYLLLSADTDEDALYTFYNDVEYPPAQEGDTVTLHVQALDQSSLDALQQSGLDVEGKHYWFVYLTSQPA